MQINKVNKTFISSHKLLSKFNPNITIFGSARVGENNSDYKDAYKLAKSLSDQGYNIITGGGPGIMEAANKGAFDGKSRSIGITIKLPNEQENNPYLDENIMAEKFFVRKVLLCQYSKAFICFKGGFGTLDELFEILNLMQTQKMQQAPIYLINKDFWHHLSRFIHHIKIAKLIDSRKYFKIFDTIEEAQEDILKTLA